MDFTELLQEILTVAVNFEAETGLKPQKYYFGYEQVTALLKYFRLDHGQLEEFDGTPVFYVTKQSHIGVGV